MKMLGGLRVASCHGHGVMVMVGCVRPMYRSLEVYDSLAWCLLAVRDGAPIEKTTDYRDYSILEEKWIEGSSM